MAYMLETRLCNDHSLKFEKLLGEALFFSLSHFSLIFLHFLIGQTPSEDDNSEDEWLEPLTPSRRRLLGKRSGGKLRGYLFFHAGIHCHYCSPFLTLGFDPFESP